MSTPTTNETFTLRQTNVSRPQLVEHSNASRQSVVAEEAFQSARSSPRPTSTDSNDALAGTDIRRFSTPPSRRISPVNSRSPIRDSARDSVRDSVASPEGVRFVEGGRIKRKPVGSGSARSSVQQQAMDSGRITPGQDDAQYVQFAVDQLTRDEEVRGSRVYAFPRTESNIPQPAERVYQPQVDVPAPVADPAAMTRRQREPSSYSTDPAATRHQRQSSSYSAVQRPVDTSKPLPSNPDPDSDLVNEEKDVEPRADVLVPWEQDIPSLDFRPAILRPLWMGIYIFLIALVNAGLLFSGIYSGINAGLFDYERFGDARYFVFQYMPTLLCVPLLIWLFQIQVALQRIAPFIALASLDPTSRSQGPLMEYLTTGFLFPKLFYFKAGQRFLGTVMIVFWLQIFTTPLLSNLFNVYYYGPHIGGRWRWLTVQGVCWTLFALYFALLVALVALLFWLRNRHTGLKWDPRSLADLTALLGRSNVTIDYARSESFVSARDFRARFALRSDRLGYWHTSKHPSEVFYGIGEEGAPTRRFSLEKGQIREKAPERSSFPPDTPSTSAGEDIDPESDNQFNRIRYRYLPFYLRPLVVVCYTVLAIALYIAFLVVSYTNRAVIHGFTPLTPVVPTSAGFSSTNFTYSFIPAIIAQFLWLAWLSVDYAFRRLQPYASMSDSTAGAPASRSLLLDYPARLPISVTLSALLARHFRIAWFSLLSLIAATIPVLAGGCFWAQFYIAEQQVRVAVETSGYYALCVFLALYAFTLPFILVNLRTHRLPHKCTSVAENMSWLYQSRILGERPAVGSKADIVTRLFGSGSASEKDAHLTGGARFAGGEHRYTFGRFVGRDGLAHLGVERANHAPRTSPLRTPVHPPLARPQPAHMSATHDPATLQSRHSTLHSRASNPPPTRTLLPASTLDADTTHPLLATPAPPGTRASDAERFSTERPSAERFSGERFSADRYSRLSEYGTPPRIASPGLGRERPLSVQVEMALRESPSFQDAGHAKGEGLAGMVAGLRDTSTTEGTERGSGAAQRWA